VQSLLWRCYLGRAHGTKPMHERGGACLQHRRRKRRWASAWSSIPGMRRLQRGERPCAECAASTAEPACADPTPLPLRPGLAGGRVQRRAAGHCHDRAAPPGARHLDIAWRGCGGLLYKKLGAWRELVNLGSYLQEHESAVHAWAPRRRAWAARRRCAGEGTKRGAWRACVGRWPLQRARQSGGRL